MTSVPADLRGSRLLLALRALRAAPLPALVGMAVVIAFVFVAAAAPLIAPYGEASIVGEQFEPWSRAFPLGTDNLGRDMLTRLVFGARNTIGLAFLTTCLAFTLGGVTGLSAAVSSKLVDQILSRAADVLISIPQLIFALLLLSIFGISARVLVLVIAVLDATRVFRVTRSVAMETAALDFVEVARLRGEGSVSIALREILPNVMTTLVSDFGLRFCFVFLMISALSFLGLGIQPPTADWGSMVRDNATLISYGDFTPLLPAGCIALLSVSVNMCVDWYIASTSEVAGEDR